MKLGYLGPQGSYSYEAAKLYASKAELVPMGNFYEIMESVEDGSIDEGILPIENSTEGAVTPVMDGLLKTEKAKIIGEIVLPIHHNLMSYGDNIDEIKYIYSHPQAIEQCREYFRRYIPKAALIACESTSTACAKAREKGRGYGAIANREAATIYDLNILKSKIQDNFLNQTRFVIISKEQLLDCILCKTSIAFTFSDDRPGSLYKVLREFANMDINLTRIESRPAKTEIGKYIFYIDFMGNPKDDIVKETLCKIEEMTVFLKILGTY